MRKELRLSIVIPTLNEAKNLPLLLSDLAELKEIAEIIIIDSNSKDATKDIASIYRAKYLRTLEKNRGLQLKTGAKSAKGNWLLFIHADSRLSQNWSQEISDILSLDNNFIYYFRFKVDHNSLIFRFLEFIVNLRTLILKTPYGDQGLLINREMYFKYDGYKNIPIMEDIDFVNRLKEKECLCELNSSIITSSRKWQKRNIFYQAIINFNLRRKWAKGYSLNEIYSKYYKRNN